MTVTVAYEENGVLYLAPESVPWAYAEDGIVYVREFPPIVTVDSEDRVFIRLPTDGPLTYEQWGERPRASVGAPGGAATLSVAGRGASIATTGQSATLTLEEGEAGIE